MVVVKLTGFEGMDICSFYLFHENMTAPNVKNPRVVRVSMVISTLTSINPAPSCMILRTAVRMWVRGNICDAPLTHGGAPSRENQTSDKNIMGQEMKFKTPVVNSSLVPLEARTSPRAVRLVLPKKKIKKRST